ncbi:MAG: ArsR family transcriptional regulator [Candidatus Brockarchaeota archaeon]|nr:ArsR family transcriptional regulator [Candidatus Brockarchaeota archaeon]
MISRLDGEEDLEYKLRGKTLQVYLHLIRSGVNESYGVREIQRALGFKSPSIASYHLEKLRELGLLSKDEKGDYRVIKEVNVGLLKLYIKIGGLRLPRLLLYACFITSMVSTYLLVYPQTLSLHNLFALLVGFSSLAILWFETFLVLRETKLKLIKKQNNVKSIKSTSS